MEPRSRERGTFPFVAFIQPVDFASLPDCLSDAHLRLVLFLLLVFFLVLFFLTLDFLAVVDFTRHSVLVVLAVNRITIASVL